MNNSNLSNFLNSKKIIIGILAFSLTIISGIVLAQSPANAEAENTGQVTGQTLPDTGNAAATEQSEQETSAAPERKIPGLSDFMLSGKYISFLILMVAGLVLLFAKKINIWVRVIMMLVAFVLFGLDYFFPLHPSPMCGVTKLFMFKIVHGKFFAAFLAIFLAIFIPSLIGRKLFCGWVCPLGALQELANKIPHKFHFKKFNFTAFNTVRFALLGLFIFTFFYVKDMMTGLGENPEVYINAPILKGYSAYSVYEPVNFFELLHWNIDATFIVMMLVLLAVSLFFIPALLLFYLPGGGINLALRKDRAGPDPGHHSKCTDCGDCEEKSPCPTIGKLKEENARNIPDCTSCGECVKACPENAIKFGFKS